MRSGAVATVTRRGVLAGAAAAGAMTSVAFSALAQVESVSSPSSAAVPVDLILVEKRRRRMHLYFRDRVLRSYRVALGQRPIGHKRAQGDGRTPEGLYAIDLKKTESRFGLGLRVSYPNARDRAAAATRREPPGGDIYIHGQPSEATALAFFRLKFAREDWTDGCIAVTNAEMAEIFRSVREGTSILIRP